MKKMFIIILIIIIISLFSLPSYVELNNLIIIEGIGVKCNKDSYTIYLKEIIPIRKDNSISYNYKLYEDTNYSLDSTMKNIINKTNKKIYLNDTRYIITDCDTSDKILKYFKIKPKYIKHTKSNIEKELK